MCGIVGYTGNKEASAFLLDGLSRLEYRGYDSAGIAVKDADDNICISKTQGKLSALIEKTKNGSLLKGSIGIGHTRWATHGAPNEENAHPHTSMDNRVVAVHNGIIENYRQIKTELISQGYTFYSETDTEVLVKLIGREYEKEKDPIKALSRALCGVRGSYALAVMFSDIADIIYTARKDSPMIIGVGNEESFIASDVPAILHHTRSVYYVGNRELAAVSKGGVTFYDEGGREIQKKVTNIQWDAASAEKDGFDSFMLKEIHEEPRAFRNTVESYITNDMPNFDELQLSDEELENIKSVLVVACGSAYHVGVVSQYVIEELAGIPVRFEYASEFRYRTVPIPKDTLCIIISQSGETADSLFAMRDAKAKGVSVLGVVNVTGSSIAREADRVIYTHAGPEIAVATTKAYGAQLGAMYLIALRIAYAKGKISEEICKTYTSELREIPNKMEKILFEKEKIRSVAEGIFDKQNAFLIGRGLDFAICLEGSLKIKEVSYIHSEAYAAGELKHGTISLVEAGTPVFGVVTQNRLAEKTLSNMAEVNSRGADLIAVVTEGTAVHANKIITIPKTLPCFAASLAVVPFQLLGYYLGTAKGFDVDKPRNLAKSVTVE